MATVMDMDRVSKWKCIFCGSKLKMKADALGNTSGKMISYSLICCHCGHVDTFAITKGGIAVAVAGAQRVGEVKLSCGCSYNEKRFCKNFDCEYRLNGPHEKPEPTRVKPAPKEIAPEQEIRTEPTNEDSYGSMVVPIERKDYRS